MRGEELPREAEDLYGLDPSEFVAARNALVRRLRREGHAAAPRVAAMTKPSPTAWALDQLARRQPLEVEEVLACGAALREALASGDRRITAEALQAERDAVRRAVGTAGAFLGRRSDADVLHSRMAETLRAAVLDPEVADLLRRGVLHEDVRAPGFDLAAAPSPRPGTRAAPGRDAGSARRAAAERRAALDKEIAGARRKAAAASAAAASAEQRAGELRQAARTAEAAVEELERKLRELGP